MLDPIGDDPQRQRRRLGARFDVAQAISHYANLVVSKSFDRKGKRVGVVAINTAICCARHALQAKGEEEPWDYGALSISERQIISHASEEVRRRAFNVVSMKPTPEPIQNDQQDAGRLLGLVNLPEGDANIEYHYQMLEAKDGVWYFALGRFMDHVKIAIEKASGYHYEFLPLGGFPNLRPYPDSVLKFETLESGAGHLPHQGYLVQWYPIEATG